MRKKQLLFRALPVMVLSMLMAVEMITGPVEMGRSSVMHIGMENEDLLRRVAEAEVEQKENCAFGMPEKREVSAKLIDVRRQYRVEPGEEFEVEIFLRNTGSLPWFSDDSSCAGVKMQLKTSRELYRDSVFYSEGAEGWVNQERLKMSQLRVNPGSIASFKFTATAPAKADLYREYFVPSHGTTLMHEAELNFNVLVGSQHYEPTELSKKLMFVHESGSVWDLDLSGEKKLLVDLSDQTVKIMLDGKEIREFRVSTGHWQTPTPKGNFEIKFKQEVRVGSQAPHYVMPKFMWFKDGGYGFHALPSLPGDGGDFWTEARDHIGTPVSHGCVRLLPEDADVVYEFSEPGTSVEIQA